MQEHRPLSIDGWMVPDYFGVYCEFDTRGGKVGLANCAPSLIVSTNFVSCLTAVRLAEG